MTLGGWLRRWTERDAAWTKTPLFDILMMNMAADMGDYAAAWRAVEACLLPERKEERR